MQYLGIILSLLGGISGGGGGGGSSSPPPPPQLPDNVGPGPQVRGPAFSPYPSMQNGQFLLNKDPSAAMNLFGGFA